MTRFLAEAATWPEAAMTIAGFFMFLVIIRGWPWKKDEE